MEANLELDPISQAVAQPKEQMGIAVQVQHQETTLQLWVDVKVTTQLEELGNVVVSDKPATVEAVGLVAGEIGLQYCNVSSFFRFLQFCLEFNLSPF